MILVAALAVVAAAPAARRSFQSSDASQSSGAVVQVYTSVTAKLGRSVPDLQRTDFEVLEDGRHREIVGFSAAPNRLRIVLLADVSGSMTLSTSLESVVVSLAQALRPDDQVWLSRFGPNIETRSQFTNSVEVLRQWAVQAWNTRHPFAGPSPLWDALNAAITALGHEAGRRAIILLTDGRATGNLLPFDAVVRHAIEANVEIGGVISTMPPPGREPRRGPLMFPWDRPADLIEVTGGLLFQPGVKPVSGRPVFDGGDMKDWIARLVDNLRTEYRLDIRPGLADGRVHALEVRLPQPGLTVRARRAHLAPPR